MATREQWIQGARPTTLPAAISPVLIGSAIAIYEGGLDLTAMGFAAQMMIELVRFD